ncbi:MAG: hypothetical protein HYZ65_15110 [Burkholderiales bacterium]|nr:hypothetical protein [Burkholderiales bacterium]
MQLDKKLLGPATLSQVKNDAEFIAAQVRHPGYDSAAATINSCAASSVTMPISSLRQNFPIKRADLLFAKLLP